MDHRWEVCQKQETVFSYYYCFLFLTNGLKSSANIWYSKVAFCLFLIVMHWQKVCFTIWICGFGQIWICAFGGNLEMRNWNTGVKRILRMLSWETKHWGWIYWNSWQQNIWKTWQTILNAFRYFPHKRNTLSWIKGEFYPKWAEDWSRWRWRSSVYCFLFSPVYAADHW